MPKARIGEIELFYQVTGEGDPILWVSGLGGDHRSWGLQVAEFQSRLRCITFDNRDVGQSASTPNAYTIREMAADAAGLLAHLEVPPAHVVGWSMGGAIAQELAISHPGRVRSLSLVATYHQGDPRGTDIMTTFALLRQRLSPEEYQRAIGPWVYTYEEYLVPGLVDSLRQRTLENPYPQSPEAYARQSQATMNHDAADRLASIRCPTLVVAAQGDILTPLWFAYALRDGIPGAQLVTVPQAGHGLLWTKAQELNRILLDFIQAH